MEMCFCNQKLETFNHLFKCKKQYNNWFKFKKGIVDYIKKKYSDKYKDINDELFEHLNNLNIWELSEKGIGSLVKGFVPINLVILLKDMKLDNSDLLLSNIINKNIKSFKFFV
jgi:hypothetical protein